MAGSTKRNDVPGQNTDDLSVLLEMKDAKIRILEEQVWGGHSIPVYQVPLCWILCVGQNSRMPQLILLSHHNATMLCVGLILRPL